MSDEAIRDSWAFEEADTLLAEVVAKTRIWGDDLQDLRQRIAAALLRAIIEA